MGEDVVRVLNAIVMAVASRSTERYHRTMVVTYG